MIHFRSTAKIRKFYPYRTGLIYCTVSMDIDVQEHYRIAKYLSNNGYQIDNHICWETEDGICFAYSDNKLLIGTSITPNTKCIGC